MHPASALAKRPAQHRALPICSCSSYTSPGDSSTGSPIRPPRVFREQQAAAAAVGAVPSSSSPGAQGASRGGKAVRLIVELPLPVKRGLSAFDAASASDDSVRVLDESDWPGGMQQRFRSLRPQVEALMEGYGFTFLGMLESPADGLGVWSMQGGGMTLAGSVTNATMPQFIKLCSGGYGSRVLEPGHVIVAVNPAWTRGEDVGQAWERDLKAQAELVIRGPPSWETLYCCKMVRSSKGTCGLLHRAYPHPWQLFASSTDDASGLGALLLAADDEPSRAQVATILNTSC